MPFSDLVSGPKSRKRSYIFFGELTSGLFQLSSDLARVLQVPDDAPCRLEKVLFSRTVSASDRLCLKNGIRVLIHQRKTSLREHVRLRIDGHVVWACIRVRTFSSSEGGNILLSGSMEFFSYRRILCDLLEHSAFTPEEIETLCAAADEPPCRAMGYLRLESDTVPEADLAALEEEILAALSSRDIPVVSVHRLDPLTFIFTLPHASLEYEHAVARLAEDILHEHYVEDRVKLVLGLTHEAANFRESLEARMVFWRELSKLYTNSLGPEKFSFREIVLTAQACIHDFEGFRLLIQPIVAKKTLELSGGEFLVRFYSDQGFGPDRFVRLLEKSSLAVPLSRFILEHCVDLAAEILKAVPKPLRFGINMSPRQTEDPELFNFIDTVLAIKGVPRKAIAIELTETEERGDQAAIARFVGQCSAGGISVAVDDFGTGYNGLDFLLSIPCDTVKISREVTIGCLSEPKKRAFLRGLLASLKELKLSTCLEGIQDKASFEALGDIGADLLQGYLFSEPIGLHAFVAFAGRSLGKELKNALPAGGPA